MTKQTTHLYGLDALRALAMVMIIITHILGKGGVKLAVEETGSVQASIAWILQGLVYCAVNCYGLISGYVGLYSSFRLSKVAYLWLQVFFYTVGMTLLFQLMGYPVSVVDWFDAFFPIIRQEYWYMTGYFSLLCFMPFINKGLQALSEREIRYVLVMVLMLFSILPISLALKVPTFNLAQGFWMNWLTILYIIGACLRRLDISKFHRPHVWLLLYFLSSLVTVAGKFLISDVWYWYSSPSLVLASLSLFMIFVHWQVSGTSSLAKWLRFLSATSLGVYLLHLHPVLVESWLRGSFAKLTTYSPPVFLGLIVASALAIYLVSTIVETGHIWLFKRLKVQERLSLIDHYFPFEK